ncbi:MAG: DAK2 domain-containing protein [Raoultibacter sp.]
MIDVVLIDKAVLSEMLCSAARLMEEQSDQLSAIDAQFGDGDHGITIAKIAKLILARVSTWGDESIRDFLEGLGMATMEVRGGSAGPLYGTMIGGLGAEITEAETALDAAGAQRMFAGCLVEMQDITNAQVGDKTMMDALIPAVAAAQAAGGDAACVFAAAATAARAGAVASEGFVSKFGRARSYKEQSIGYPDAGALSTALFIEGLSAGLSRSEQAQK